MNTGRIFLVVLAAVFVLASVASAATPLRWTPAKASSLIHAKCVGVGAGVGKPKKYVGFKCTAGTGATLWVKIRPDGQKACWSRTSLAAIPAYCMVLPGQG